jgi:hypothetical protein
VSKFLELRVSDQAVLALAWALSPERLAVRQVPLQTFSCHTFSRGSLGEAVFGRREEGLAALRGFGQGVLVQVPAVGLPLADELWIKGPVRGATLETAKRAEASERLV